ncbi:hypothetical protein CREGCYN_10740 [Synechococcus sp. M16CYN]
MARQGSFSESNLLLVSYKRSQLSNRFASMVDYTPEVVSKPFYFLSFQVDSLLEGTYIVGLRRRVRITHQSC